MIATARLSAILPLAGLVLAPFLFVHARTALADLAAARQETAGLAVEATSRPPAPVPLLPEAALIPAADSDAAAALLATRLRGEAARGGLLVERLAPLPGPAPLVAARIVASGPEAAVLRFARAMEAGAPLIRFAGWRLEGAGAGLVRLDARAVALRRTR
ncbi:hypothetical protein [Sphingomonas profundi]|uniref:hypothetical protein n=1 Tax=Alterirhizorhabdus profundi TaxID=2681549 RepID=UPI0012E78840|nr:hypothetical protein [Sphingomonas profundi]